MADNLYTAIIEGLTFKEDIDEDTVKRKATELVEGIKINTAELADIITEECRHNGNHSGN